MRAKTLILVASAAGLAVIFAALGQWQLERARERRALEAQFATFAEDQRLKTLPDGESGEVRYRPVALRGRYLPQTQVLSDNMTHAGVVGYHVLTPFVSTDGRVVVVNRGFVPAPPSRSDLPNVAVSTEERALLGRIDALPKPALRLKADDTDEGPVRVMSFPDAEDLERALGRPVASYQILLDPGEPDGYLRDWKPSGITAERNLAYAGQWLALGAATLIAAVGCLVSALRKRSGA